jgi:hypothetical protein
MMKHKKSSQKTPDHSTLPQIILQASLRSSKVDQIWDSRKQGKDRSVIIICFMSAF